MKAQLKHTQMVEVELPEYFMYTRYNSKYCCRLMGENIVEISDDISIYTAQTIIKTLGEVESSNFHSISREIFLSHVNEVVEKISAE